MKRPIKPASGADLAASFLGTLKARNEKGRVLAIRGSIFSRVMVSARDARLSGAEWSVLATIALHLQHMGRESGMMTLETLAEDAMVTQRTIRNALRTLEACGFVHTKRRTNGQLELRLDKRFSPKTPVPGNAVPGQRRRSTQRKKISKSAPHLVSHTLPLRSSYSSQRMNNSQPSAGAPGRESSGVIFRKGTADGTAPWLQSAPRRSVLIRFGVRNGVRFAEYGPAPPRRKRLSG